MKIVIVLYHFAIIAVSLFFIFTNWEPPTPQNPTYDESNILKIVILFGLLGGSIHGTTSAVTRIANDKFNNQWSLWYFSRPFVAVALSIVFYVVIRGGLFSSSQDAAAINYYGFAAVGALVGLMSDVAAKKLRDIFNVSFGISTSESERGDISKEYPDLTLTVTKESITIGEVLEIKTKLKNKQGHPQSNSRISFQVDHPDILIFKDEIKEVTSDGNGNSSIRIIGNSKGDATLTASVNIDSIDIKKTIKISVA